LIIRYLDLLSECFYRSDHVGIPFEEARAKLEKYREYTDLTKPQRISLYENYMDELSRRYKEKQKSMQTLKAPPGPNGGESAAAVSEEEEEAGSMDGSVNEARKSSSSSSKKKRKQKDKDKDKDKKEKKQPRHS
jgi:hypothetical protein